MLRKLWPSAPHLPASVLNIGLLLALLGGSAFFSFTIFSNKQDAIPPRVIESIFLEPTLVLPGRSFRVHIRATITQLCPGQVTWSLLRADDNTEIVRIIEPTKTPTALGPTEIVAERTVPKSVAPGEYFYVATIQDICGPDRKVSISVTKPIALTVR